MASVYSLHSFVIVVIDRATELRFTIRMFVLLHGCAQISRSLISTCLYKRLVFFNGSTLTE